MAGSTRNGIILVIIIFFQFESYSKTTSLFLINCLFIVMYK